MALRRATSHALRLALRPRGGVRFGSSGGYPGEWGWGGGVLPGSGPASVCESLRWSRRKVLRSPGTEIVVASSVVLRWSATIF